MLYNKKKKLHTLRREKKEYIKEVTLYTYEIVEHSVHINLFFKQISIYFNPPFTICMYVCIEKPYSGCWLSRGMISTFSFTSGKYYFIYFMRAHITLKSVVVVTPRARNIFDEFFSTTSGRGWVVMPAWTARDGEMERQSVHQ